MRARRADAIYQDRIRLLAMRIQGAPQCASSADMPWDWFKKEFEYAH